MLIYKVGEEKESIFNMGDFSYMLDLVMQNYRNYFKASEFLQSRYDFSLQAIYSCLSEVNNKENLRESYKELYNFLIEVKKRAGFEMQIVKNKNTLFVKEKPKVKVKRYRLTS